jgi:predicted DNA-binding transcriptional regulator AlpA
MSIHTESPSEAEALLTERGVAARIAVSPRTLQLWRRLGKGPPFVRLGRAVRYPSPELTRWLSAARSTQNS